MLALQSLVPNLGEVEQVDSKSRRDCGYAGVSSA